MLYSVVIFNIQLHGNYQKGKIISVFLFGFIRSKIRSTNLYDCKDKKPYNLLKFIKLKMKIIFEQEFTDVDGETYSHPDFLMDCGLFPLTVCYANRC